jgi:F420H(2)-dependent quinone reductase
MLRVSVDGVRGRVYSDPAMRSFPSGYIRKRQGAAVCCYLTATRRRTGRRASGQPRRRCDLQVDRGRVARTLLRAPARLYDWRCGWLLGHRFLRLTHVGRNSGRRYQTMLEVIGTGPAVNEFLVVSDLGRAADWYRNLRATPAVEVAGRLALRRQ